jgi:MFS family permease
MSGALGYRLPADDWRPAGVALPSSATTAATNRYVSLQNAWRTRQFWLLWAVLCLNVTAGIGILGMASPLLQEMFAGRLIGVPVAFTALDTSQLAQIAAIAAGFTGLLSLFNIAGRFCWASLSDRIGRRMTYSIFFLLGFALYASIPWTARLGDLGLFVAFFCVILSMYGGGFATIPAYLADLFGTRMVGAIHGRLLTAWSTAGVLGPVLVNYIRDYQIDHGIARANVYSITMYILAGLLLVGFVCNSLVRPVDERLFAASETPGVTARAAVEAPFGPTRRAAPHAQSGWQVWGAWLAVGIPIIWGVKVTLEKALVLFR